jgi:hypothetical protein
MHGEFDGLTDLFQGRLALEQDGTDFQVSNTVDHGAFAHASEDDDGESLEAEVGADDFEEAGAIHLGHEEVEDDGVGHFGEQAGEGLFAIGEALDGVAGVFEEEPQRRALIGGVVDDEDRGNWGNGSK